MCLLEGYLELCGWSVGGCHHAGMVQVSRAASKKLDHGILGRGGTSNNDLPATFLASIETAASSAQRISGNRNITSAVPAEFCIAL